jgi:hypothetical protein
MNATQNAAAWVLAEMATLPTEALHELAEVLPLDIEKARRAHEAAAAAWLMLALASVRSLIRARANPC